jgi:hypothetical protein
MIKLFRSRGSDVESRLVWLLGSPRSGSTWLLNLIGRHPQICMSDEPGIGYHLGVFAADVMGCHPTSFDRSPLVLPAAREGDPNYFFAEQFASTWRAPTRDLILARFAEHLRTSERTTERPNARVLLIKEPAGSQAAGFLFSLLPKARLLFLVRDGRDVVDSLLDACEGGAWLAKHFSAEEPLSPEERQRLLVGQAHRWVHQIRAVSRVYDSLPDGQRLLIRYEDCRIQPVEKGRQIFDWLGLPHDREQLQAFSAATSAQNVPEHARGKGKFLRLAQPGAWQKRFTAAEQQELNRIMKPTLRQFGYV